MFSCTSFYIKKLWFPIGIPLHGIAHNCPGIEWKWCRIAMKLQAPQFMQVKSTCAGNP